MLVAFEKLSKSPEGTETSELQPLKSDEMFVVPVCLSKSPSGSSRSAEQP